LAEFTNSSTVSVAANQNVPLTETAVSGGSCIVHRTGSGLVTLRGITNGQCRARYKVSFGANIAAATAVSAVSVALAINGEPLNSATAIYTPAAVGDYGNVTVSAFIDVPRGCCVTVAAENTSAQTITVANAALIAERVA